MKIVTLFMFILAFSLIYIGGYNPVFFACLFMAGVFSFAFNVINEKPLRWFFGFAIAFCIVVVFYLLLTHKVFY